jgi:hypothetical protein
MLDILNVKLWENRFSNDIMVAAHTMMRFGFLDKILDALGFPVFKGLSEKERLKFPQMSGKMEDKVRNVSYCLVI